MRLFLCIYFMTSALILAAVEDALRVKVADNRGAISVAETETDAIEALATAPDKWRVILSMDGDKALDAFNPAGTVRATLVAWVQAPTGMALQPQRNLHRPAVKGTPAFFTRLHWVIRQIRGLSLLASDIDRRGFEYLGWEWLKFEGQPLFRTAKASFELIFAHDDPETDPEAAQPLTLPSPFRIVASGGDYYVVSLGGDVHGRVPRFEPGAVDPNGTATGYAIVSAPAEYYTVAFDGIPHGRIPRFEPS